jgi:hypothetical protein
VFDGDPQARVKDRDRDRAVYVVDAALRNGQISQQDRDLRVERARAAHTIGELQALTRDVAAPPAPVPPTAVVPPPVAPVPTATPGVPNPYDPGSTRPVAGVPSDLYGPAPSATKPVAGGTGLTTKPSQAGRKVVLGCVAVVLVFLIVPIVFGAILVATQSGDSGTAVETDPIPAGPPFELSGSGLRAYVAVFEETFDDTEVVRTVFYDGYVVAWVPQDGGKVALWNYLDGAFVQLGDPMDDAVDTAPVDLAELKPAKVMSLVREAQTLGVEGDVMTYVIYDRDVIEDLPHVMVYVSNDEGQSGYVIGDLDGNVLQRTTP